MTVTIGKPVENFTTQATTKSTVSLKDMKGSTNFVLYFYPKDSTPGCTSEGQAFAENCEAFKDAGTIIFGVSKDTMKSHENFKAKQEYPFELISDSDEELCKLFDVIRLKKMYGKEFMGIERSTFLIDKDGILQHEWRKVKIKGHVDDVLQAAQALDGQVEPISSTLDNSPKSE